MPQMQRGNYLGNFDQQQQALNQQAMQLQAQQAQALANQMQVNRQRKIDFTGEQLKQQIAAWGTLTGFAQDKENIKMLADFNKLIGMSPEQSESLIARAKDGTLNIADYEAAARNYSAAGAYGLKADQPETSSTVSTDNTRSDGTGGGRTVSMETTTSQPVIDTYGYMATGEQIAGQQPQPVNRTQPEQASGQGLGEDVMAYIINRQKRDEKERALGISGGGDYKTKQAAYDEAVASTTAAQMALGQKYSPAELDKLYNSYISGENLDNIIKGFTKVPESVANQQTSASNYTATGNPNFKNEVQGVYYDIINKTGMLGSPVYGGVLFGTQDRPQKDNYAALRKALSDAIQGETNKTITGKDWSGSGSDAEWNNTKLPVGKEVNIDMAAIGRRLLQSGVDLSPLTPEAKTMFGIDAYPGSSTATNTTTPVSNASFSGNRRSTSGDQARQVDFTSDQGMSSGKMSIEGTVDGALKNYESQGTLPEGSRDALLNKLRGMVTSPQDDAIARYAMGNLVNNAVKGVQLEFKRNVAQEAGSPSKKLLDALERNVQAVNEGTYSGYLNTLIPIPSAEDLKTQLDNIYRMYEIEGLSQDNIKKRLANLLDIDTYDDKVRADSLKDELTNAQIQNLISSSYKATIEALDMQNAIEASGGKETFEMLGTLVQPILDTINEEAGDDPEKANRLKADWMSKNPDFKKYYPMYLDAMGKVIELADNRQARVNFDTVGDAYKEGFGRVLLDYIGFHGESTAIPTLELGNMGSASQGASSSSGGGALNLGNLPQ